MTLEALLGSLDLGGDIPVDVLLGVLETFLEAPSGLFAKNNTVRDVLHTWLDIDLSMDEDCLHLAVSTPWPPTGSVPPAIALLPLALIWFGLGAGSIVFVIKLSCKLI